MTGTDPQRVYLTRTIMIEDIVVRELPLNRHQDKWFPRAGAI